MASPERGQHKLALGFALGIGATVVARELLPPFRQALRPLAKAGVTAGLLALEQSREWLARLGENVEDMVAEVKMEQELAHLRETAAEREATPMAMTSDATATERAAGRDATEPRAERDLTKRPRVVRRGMEG